MRETCSKYSEFFVWSESNGAYNPGQGIWSGIEKCRWNWTGQGGFDIYFCGVFHCYCGGLVSGGGGEWALGYLFTQIFLMFGYFLILFPNRSLKPFEKSNTKFALLDITFRFTCG